MGDLGIYIDGTALSIADAIADVESGSRELNSIGERLRAKALGELDYGKIAAELSSEYARIGGKGQLLQIQPRTVA